MSKVIVGMSGGVDSAVAAFLLKEKGYEVIGVTLRTWLSEDGTESRCCEIDDARRTAWELGIRYYPYNCLELFKEKVIEPFAKDYIRGLTPNPCIECNRYVKWGKMEYIRQVFDADYIATGHYAHVIEKNGRYTVRTADYTSKDQTYMLYKLTQEQLAHTLMPLGGYSKEQVRDIARDIGMEVAGKKDSQELCFVTEGNHADYIDSMGMLDTPGAGAFTDKEGNILGTHKGIHHYTIGQRKGLGIALGTPRFVTKLNPSSNEVVLGDESDLMKQELLCGELNFLSVERIPEGDKIRCNAKIRYAHKASPAVIYGVGDDMVRVVFDEAVRAPSPGQSAVFYDDEGCVIGGGRIMDQKID
ncbi:MAG: tRNA 2-thiouridine(34) synthase MnmA [Saccharofermentans sp.]|nr:tRNA 2-thiouridine(34) synthase MnmA [Saccharofermentans sp.]